MSVLVVLGVIWAAVLIPPALRARSERRAEFIDSFQAQMGALGGKARAGRAAQTPETPVAAPVRFRRPASPVKRRRDILGGLLGAMIGSLLLGAIPSLRAVLALHLFLLNLFLGYLALLAHQRALALRRQARFTETKVEKRPSVSVRRRRQVREPTLAPVLHAPLISRR